MNTTANKQKDYVSFTGYLNGQKNNGQGLNFDGFLPSLTEDKKGNAFLSGTPNKNTSSDELAKAKNTIKETVANSLGNGRLLSNFDKVTDDALIRGSKTAKETIDNNIKTGKLPSDARETYPYLTDGMTLFYAAGELGLNDVADYSRNLAYTTNNAPKQESNTERQRQENHERARAKGFVAVQRIQND